MRRFRRALKASRIFQLSQVLKSATRRYHGYMSDSGVLGDYFAWTVREACIRAREQTLRSGVPVFYRDPTAGIYVMEYADGRRFEIKFLPGEPRDRNFQVLREIGK